VFITEITDQSQVCCVFITEITDQSQVCCVFITEITDQSQVCCVFSSLPRHLEDRSRQQRRGCHCSECKHWTVLMPCIQIHNSQTF